MGLVSKWASDDTLVKEALSQDDKKRTSTTSSPAGSTQSSQKASPKKKNGLLESKWATAEDTPPSSSSEISPQKKHRDNHKPQRRGIRDNKQLEVVRNNKPKIQNKSPAPSQDLASRLGISVPQEHRTEVNNHLSEESEEEEQEEVEESSEESEEEISRDLKDLSIGAQDFATRLGLMAKSPNSPKKPQHHTTKDKKTHSHSNKKPETGHLKSKVTRNNNKQTATIVKQTPPEPPKPSINFDKMFDNFSKGEGLDWADDDDDGWDFSKLKD